MFTRFEEEWEEYLWMVMVTKREKGFKTDEEAKQWLIDSGWVCGGCELWNPQTEDSTPIDELFVDWKKWLVEEATDEDLENMGFYIHEEEMI